MLISLVVAAAEDHAIGGGNALLWKLPNDMKFFKNLTWGMVVIMGRKTFASMGYKPLPGRVNVVISRDPGMIEQTTTLLSAGSLEQALELARNTDCREAFVIGGGEIYKQSLPLVDRIYLTRVHAYYPDADTHFNIDDSFGRVEITPMPADDKHAVAYDFEIWDKIQLGV
jgi:dihydrofolate reductase